MSMILTLIVVFTVYLLFLLIDCFRNNRKHSKNKQIKLLN